MIYYVATVPELPGCHTQAKSLDDLMNRIKGAILLYLETEGCSIVGCFVGCRLSKLKPVEAKVAIKALGRMGFLPVRQRGSHLIMKHPNGRSTVIPVHIGEELGRGS